VRSITLQCLLVLALAAPASAQIATVDQAVLDAEAQREAVVAKVNPSVLAIFSPDGNGGGSGVVISPDGYALTNFHVAKPCGNAMKCGMPDGRLYDAVIVGLDPTGDIALIRLLGRTDFPAASLGDSDRLRAGDWVFVIGNPFLLADDFQPTVTYGILSGVHRYQFPAGTLLEYTDCLQTDAAINPGNSGGPLFDDQGRLVGIVGRGSFEKRGRVSVDVGYAVSINQIKNFMGYLRSGRIVDHATLGARVAFDDEGRVVVNDILEHSDAYRRGLRYGDEILSFGGRAIDTPNAFKNVLGIFPKGWRVPLSFRQNGQRRDVLVRLDGVHGEEELIEKTGGQMPKLPGPQPKPSDRPQGKPRPGEKKPRAKEQEIPGPDPESEPIAPGRRPAAMPAIVKKHFEARRGYANYYFNRENRQRVWKAWDARFHPAGNNWRITARQANQNPLWLELGPTGAELRTANGLWKWQTDSEGEAALAPSGSGGLLLALHLWHRLAVLGPKGFGDVYYLGTVPVDGSDTLAGLLVGLHAGVECHFLFDPREGHLLGLEMFAAEDVDPCEVKLSDYREVDGRWLPRSMRVRRGDEVFAELTLDEFRFSEASQ